jgi:hypothetical protein
MNKLTKTDYLVTTHTNQNIELTISQLHHINIRATATFLTVAKAFFCSQSSLALNNILNPARINITIATNAKRPSARFIKF